MAVYFSKLAAFTVLFAVGLLAAPSEAGTHKDPRIGFQVTVPSGYTVVPLQANEAWIVARYKAGKEDRFRDKERGGAYTYAPTMTVVVFLDEIMDSETEVASEGGDVKVTIESPFEDYLDFLTKTRPGFYVESDEETEQNGLPVRCLEIAHTGQVPMRIVTWIYTTQLGKVAVEIDCLEGSWKKRKRDALKVVKSLRAIEITEELDLISKYQNRFSSVFSYTISAEERAIRRKESEESAWRDAQASLVSGWKAKKIKDVPVLTVDMGHATKVVERVNGVRKWLESNFDVIGEGEYVRMPLVRVFEDAQAENDFQRGLGETANEIVTNKAGRLDLRQFNLGRSIMYANELGYVNYQTMRLWFSERDRDVYRNMPPWLRWGLSQMISQAVPKGKRLTFPSGDAERFFNRKVDTDTLPTVRELMKMSDAEFNDDWVVGLGHSQALVRYFLDGPGAKNKATKDVLPTYLGHLSDLVKEAREQEFEGADEEPETEEEEEELERKRREWLKNLLRHIIDETFNRTFDGWDDARWRIIENAFAKSF